MVETGFPTSLIDLFVKNRDRLKKKHPKIKKTKYPVQIQPPYHETSAPPSPQPPTVSDDSTLSGLPVFNADSDPAPSNEIIKEVSRGKDEGTEPPCRDRRDRSQGIFPSVLKLFVVVFGVILVLVMSTRRLALCITMSAFLLIFAEYVSKRSVRFVKPYASAKLALDSLLRRVSQVVSMETGVLALTNITSSEEGLVVQEETIGAHVIGGTELNMNPLVQEIEIVETNCDMNEDKRIEEIVNIGPELEFLSRYKRWGCLDKETEAEEVQEHTEGGQTPVSGNERCQSTKVKSKILKKLVPKKFRNSKKNKKSNAETTLGESSSEVSSNLGDDMLSTLEEQDEQENGKEEQESQHKSSLSVLQEEKCEEQLVVDGNPCTQEVSPANREGRESKGNLRYPPLLVIVLAGLVGGRALAVVVTISWCFMLKLIGTRRQSVNVPVMGRPLPISS